MRLPLVGVAAVVALAPSAHGAADFIDARLAVLLAYLALASLQGPRGAPAKRWTAALAVAAGRGAGRPGGAALGRIRRLGDEFREAIRAVPPGARVLAVAPPAGRCPALDAADFYRGLINFVVIDRRALASTLFTGRGMQPVAARDPRLDATPWTPPHRRLARQPRLARPLRHADRPARRLRLAARRAGPDADRRNAASDDLPPALRPDLAELAIRIMSGRFRSRPGDGRRREE